jgi:uncharacterized protein
MAATHPLEAENAARRDPVPVSKSFTLLAISDVAEDLLYSPAIRDRYGHVDLVISCGDLPPSYLDYVTSTLNVPLYGVRGNHDGLPEHGEKATWTHDTGMTNLHGTVRNADGLLLAGFEGSRRYNSGPVQYSEREMQLLVARMAPRLLANKARHGRYLDILVTHAPPRHVNDQEDLCHQGFETFRWFLERFRPRFHLHGHIHLYANQGVRQSQFHDTTVLNVYGHREVKIAVPLRDAGTA